MYEYFLVDQIDKMTTTFGVGGEVGLCREVDDALESIEHAFEQLVLIVAVVYKIVIRTENKIENSPECLLVSASKYRKTLGYEVVDGFPDVSLILIELKGKSESLN